MDLLLPVLYQDWIPHILPGPLPDEKRATCSDCAMCAAESVPQFHQKTKCCTYIPAIPNFLAGMILQMNATVFLKYWSRADVRPQGVWPDAEFAAQYHPSSNLFGKNIQWRCPYYLEEEGGLCGIWQYRNGRCATWFCKHMRGRLSHDFWSAVEELLTAVERSLSHWCIHELDAGDIEFQQAFPVQIGKHSVSTWLKQQSFYQQNSSNVTESFFRSVWGKWFGEEQRFFQECAGLVFALRWSDVQVICGPELNTLQGTVLRTYDNLNSNSFPEILKLAEFQRVDVNDADVRIWSVNPYDPVTLTKTVLRLLHRCSGMKMAEVEQHIPKELLMRLFDAGIIAF